MTLKLIKEIITPENTEYREIHNQIFPSDDYHSTSVYYKCFENDEYKGFLSGYFHSLNTFYIQRIGIIELFKGTKQSERLANFIWDEIKKEGIRFLMGTIETGNIPTIIVALKTGFIIHGFRVDTGGKQYVEIIKEL